MAFFPGARAEVDSVSNWDYLKIFLNPFYYSGAPMQNVYSAPENAVIYHRNVPTDIQNEDRFSPMNVFAFSPLSQDLPSIDNGIFALLMFFIAKNKPDLFKAIVIKYMDVVGDVLTSVVNSGKAHPLTALNASTEFAVVAHRFGFITDSGYLKMADQTRSIIDKLIQLNFASMTFEGLTSLVEATPKGAKGLSTLAHLVKR